MKFEKIVSIFLFLTITMIVFILLNNLFTPNWNEPNGHEDTTLVLKEFENLAVDPEVLIVGTSCVSFGVSPIQLYEEHGILSYNVATSAQPMDASYYLVQDAFARGYHPRVVVLDVLALYSDLESENVYRYITDSTSFTKSKMFFIRGYLDRKIKHYRLFDALMEEVSYYIPFFRYHSRWEELKKVDYSSGGDSDYFMQGFYMSSKINASKSNNEIISESERRIQLYNGNYSDSVHYYESNVDYLRKIDNLCKANNCDLLLIKIPIMIEPTSWKYYWSKQRSEEIKALSNSLAIPFVDYTYTKELVMDYAHDTIDGGKHLNLLGAEKVTASLGGYLNEHYSLTHQRNSEYDTKAINYNKCSEMAHILLSYSLSDYLDKLMKASEDYYVVISVNDDMTVGIRDEEILALNRFGLQTDFYKMDYGCSYIAVIDNNGNIKYEMSSENAQSYIDNIDGINIVVSSKGNLEGKSSSIVINGDEVSLNKRGLNIVLINKNTGMVVDCAICDTSADNHELLHQSQVLFRNYIDWLLER